MSITYVPTTNFGAKDSLPANDPAKVIKGAEFTTEYTAIQSAFALAAPASNPTFTGTATFDGLSVVGAFTSLGIDDNATSTAITIDASQNVGIGTDAPASPLHVISGVDGNIIQANGSANSFDFILKGTNGGTSNSTLYELGLYRSDGATHPNTVLKFGRGGGSQSGFFTISQNDEDALHVDSDGNIGIGTTTPSYTLSLDAQEQSAGTYIALQNAGANFLSAEWGGLIIDSADASGAGAGVKGSIRATSEGSNGSSVGWEFNVGSAAGNDRTAMVLDSAGNVGIGTGTPESLLTVQGDSPAITVNATNNNKPRIELQRDASTVNWRMVNDAAVLKHEFGDDSTSWTETYQVSSGKNHYWNTDQMALLQNGNVGIGTVTPKSTAHVRGPSDSTNFGSTLLIEDDAALGADIGGSVAFLATDGSAARTYGRIRGGKETAGSGSFDGYLAFETRLNGQADTTEHMRIESDGDVLVGTTDDSPTVGNGVKILPQRSTDTPSITLNGASSSTITGFQMYSTGAAANRFYVRYDGQIYATQTSITGISDATLKENVRDLEVGLDAVMALQPRRFDWKNGDGNDVMGFVAQEVETVLPELVREYDYDGDETKKGLKMGDMLPTVVKAIQEQQAIIEALKAEVEALKNA